MCAAHDQLRLAPQCPTYISLVVYQLYIAMGNSPEHYFKTQKAISKPRRRYFKNNRCNS